MLEHETIQGILGSKPTGLRKKPEDQTITVDILLQHLGMFHTTMRQHGMDLDTIKQVVKQQFYIICAVTLNHLLLRKDMCCWSKGLQIRYSREHNVQIQNIHNSIQGNCAFHVVICQWHHIHFTPSCCFNNTIKQNSVTVMSHPVETGFFDGLQY